MIRTLRTRTWVIGVLMALPAGCGEPVYENAGSANSLIVDREACAMEIDQSPMAHAYRQNPAAHPEYPIQALEDTSHCIEKKGWGLVRSQAEQEQIRDAVASGASQASRPVELSDSSGMETLRRAIESKLELKRGRSPGSDTGTGTGSAGASP